MKTLSELSYKGNISQKNKDTLEVSDNKLPDLRSLYHSYSEARCMSTSGSRLTPVGLPSISKNRGTDWRGFSFGLNAKQFSEYSAE